MGRGGSCIVIVSNSRSGVCGSRAGGTGPNDMAAALCLPGVETRWHRSLKATFGYLSIQSGKSDCPRSPVCMTPTDGRALDVYANIRQNIADWVEEAIEMRNAA